MTIIVVVREAFSQEFVAQDNGSAEEAVRLVLCFLLNVAGAEDPSCVYPCCSVSNFVSFST